MYGKKYRAKTDLLISLGGKNTRKQANNSYFYNHFLTTELIQNNFSGSSVSKGTILQFIKTLTT